MSLLGKLFKKLDPQQAAIDAYNLGLAAKYEGRWRESLEHNQRAALLNPDDEATWWNLAIAATALHDWSEARRGWIACGITPDQAEGEVTTPENWACVRLVPDSTAEVVWGKRIDPARIIIMNVPLPESNRLYGDIILNDGAEEGLRVSNGHEYPVFNELAVWKRSRFSSFAVEVTGANEESKGSLERICDEHAVHFEDWGTVRMLCAACSRGNPGEHECVNDSGAEKPSRFGFAATGAGLVEASLAAWREVEPGIRHGDVELVVCGGTQ